MEAYYTLKKRQRFVRAEDKIMISSLPLPLSIPIGSTKNSVVKFWSGAGVIETTQNGSYTERILSISQYEKALELDHETVNINLTGLSWIDKIKVFKKSFDFSVKSKI